jgi:hypothetical protein
MHLKEKLDKSTGRKFGGGTYSNKAGKRPTGHHWMRSGYISSKITISKGMPSFSK